MAVARERLETVAEELLRNLNERDECPFCDLDGYGEEGTHDRTSPCGRLEAALESTTSAGSSPVGVGAPFEGGESGGHHSLGLVECTKCGAGVPAGSPLCPCCARADEVGSLGGHEELSGEDSDLLLKVGAATKPRTTGERLAYLVGRCEERRRCVATVAALSQVALEAIRLVHGSQLGDRHSHEPCGECGLGGEGALRDALTKALGPGYTGLVWGNDMNVDCEKWDAALAVQGSRIAESAPDEVVTQRPDLQRKL